MSDLRSEEVSFPWEDLVLTGSLFIPGASGPHPGVLMMQGSGPTDRGNDGYFPPLRDAFLEKGIAVYSFDKPGVGKSTGDWRTHALEERVGQSAAAREAMAAHSEIDAGRLGVWGHSQGGWLAQILASRIPNLTFAICNSGPSIGVEEQDLYGCEHTMRARGHSEDEIDEALAFLASLHAEAHRGGKYATVEERLIGPARGEPWYGYLTIDEEADWTLLRKLITEKYQPIETMRRIKCPYLAVYGGSDLLVPAWESARESGEALLEAGNADTTIVVFPGGNHRVQKGAGGGFVTGYLDLVTHWAAGRVTP